MGHLTFIVQIQALSRIAEATLSPTPTELFFVESRLAFWCSNTYGEQ